MTEIGMGGYRVFQQSQEPQNSQEPKQRTAEEVKGLTALEKLSLGMADAEESGFKKVKPKFEKPTQQSQLPAMTATELKKPWRADMAELQKLGVVESVMAYKEKQFDYLKKQDYLQHLGSLEHEATKQAIAFGEHRYASKHAEDEWKKALDVREAAQKARDLLIDPRQ